MNGAKRAQQRRLAREQHAITRRLKAAVVLNAGGPVLGRANIGYELAGRSRGVAHGGIGMIAALIAAVGLAAEIDESVAVLAQHRPYHESDHVLNIAYNALCGGRRLDDIDARRNDAVFLDAIGAASIPDPTTAGDFCRRFDQDTTMALQTAVNRARLRVWARQPVSFTDQTARIDADATFVVTGAQAKEGIDISYKGTWGYSALIVSLANTAEPLFLDLHGANRPSHAGVVPLFDRAAALCRQAGFADVMLRGDTDYSLTGELDRWDREGTRFVFGYDAMKNLVERADAAPSDDYHQLVAHTERHLKTAPRTKPRNVKDGIVRARGYKKIRTTAEDVAEFDYRPGKCQKDYRIVALRKDLSVEKGDNVLFHQYRYFFYITNDRAMTADQVVAEARDRCNQENLIAHLKGDVRALHAPVNTLNANLAYMTMASIAWSLKAWCALLLPVSARWADQHNEQRRRLLTMEFRTFRGAMIDIPCQIVQTSRSVRWRIQAWNPWLSAFLRLFDALKT